MCMIDINEVLREVDFVINVEAGRNPIVLQLTDTQIIDSSQQRMKGRLSSAQQKVWAPDQIYKCCYKYLSEIIKETKPDLLFIYNHMLLQMHLKNMVLRMALLKLIQSILIYIKRKD